MTLEKGSPSVYEWIFKRPSRAIKIYYGGGRKDAILEMCISCVGTAQEARQCPCVDCPLWTFRPGAKKGFVPDFVPTKKELMNMKDSDNES